jgi:putative SOS response-associated peptidase YedK
MCGRFQLSVKGREISERFNVEVFDGMYKPSYNCAPAQNLVVVTAKGPGFVQLMRWGLIPKWSSNSGKPATPLINSRSETILEKPAFRDAFRMRRCLVPANGFYEWKNGAVKIPYRFHAEDNSLFAMAGIWEEGRGPDQKPVCSFSILTTEANKVMQDVHHRMPVILAPEDEERWLLENDTASLMELLKPANEGKLRKYPVSSRVNNTRNDDESLINPIEVFPGDLFSLDV